MRVAIDFYYNAVKVESAPEEQHIDKYDNDIVVRLGAIDRLWLNPDQAEDLSCQLHSWFWCKTGGPTVEKYDRIAQRNIAKDEVVRCAQRLMQKHVSIPNHRWMDLENAVETLEKM